MKDIEQLLARSGGPRPGRQLRADFTNSVMRHLDDRPQRRGFVRVLETRFMRIFTKPAAIVAAIIFAAIVGGTAYAAVGGWPGVTAIFGAQQRLPSGDRVVKVDLQNCSYMSPFTATHQNKEVGAVYYKIKDNSKLTNDQVVQMVRGNCYEQQQADFDMNTVESALNANPLNKDKVVGGYIDSEVMAISATSLTIKSVVPHVTNNNEQLVTVRQTFNHIDPAVVVYDSPNRISLSDIHVGDHVSIKYRASGDALSHSEAIAPDQIDPDQQVVVAIVKNSNDVTAAVNYQKYNGAEFEQVAPCSTQPSGYCTYEQYIQK